jgi:CRISPR-associated protein Csx10
VELEPRPAILSIRSAHFPKILKTALSTQPLEELLEWAEKQQDLPENEKQQIAQRLQIKRQLKSAIAFLKPGVGIDPKTGSAMPDYLRFEEVVRMKAVLKAEDCTLDFSSYPNLSEDQKKAAYALLLAGTKMVERIGGKRRRGNGNCEMTIDPKVEQWLQWFKDNHANIAPPPVAVPPELLSSEEAHVGDATWYRIPLTLTAQSPVILPKRTVGNVVESLDYIPGRYFLRYLHKKLGNFLNVKDAIAQGNLVITNATIAIGEGLGRPTPLCLFGEKLDGGLSKGRKVYNRFQEPEESLQLKGERSGYIGQFDGSQLPDYKTLKLEINTHNTIDDQDQRPSAEAGGGVYSYQAIPTKTVLKAELRFPQSVKTQLDQKDRNWHLRLNTKPNHPHAIGQSKKDQYGLIAIAGETPTPFPSRFQKEETIDYLYVWLLSDVLLRDQRLAPTTDPDQFKRELEQCLAVTLEECCDRVTPEGKELLSLIRRSRRTESWQVRWGLPRPSMLGWQAGSCAVYRVRSGTVNPQKLTEIEAKGIGDRCAEGYGQICFNDPLLTEQLSHLQRATQRSKPTLPNRQYISSNDPAFEYARTIETAAWRCAIENKALTLAANPSARERIIGIKIEGEDSHPPMSQLSGLRSSLRRLQSLRDQNRLTSWITAVESVSNRKEKWDKTEQGLRKIHQLVTDLQKIWQELDISSPELVITVGARNELQQILWAEAVRTLVDAIIRAHKRDLEKVQNPSFQEETV